MDDQHKESIVICRIILEEKGFCCRRCERAAEMAIELVLALIYTAGGRCLSTRPVPVLGISQMCVEQDILCLGVGNLFHLEGHIPLFFTLLRATYEWWAGPDAKAGRVAMNIDLLSQHLPPEAVATFRTMVGMALESSKTMGARPYSILVHTMPRAL